MTLSYRSPLLATLVTFSLTCALDAQTVVEIPAPTVATSSIDMDAVGPAGPTTLAAINAAAAPAGGAFQNIVLNPNTAAAGVYNTNPGQGRALGMDPAVPGGLILVDPPTGAFAAFDAELHMTGPSTEFGFGVADWNGPMALDFYSGGVLVASHATSAYSATSMVKYYQFQPGGGITSFDRVDIRASTTGGNWVITDLEVQILIGTYPNFTWNPSSGSSPLTVNFTDATFSSHGIVAWAWDIDNDGTPEYSSQNCSHTYTAGGIYSVTLTVIDGQNNPFQITKNNIIEIDIPDAQFTYQTLGCNAVLFTDTSTGNPTSWAWDVDNDGTTDYTTQNVGHQYPAAGVYQCKLTVSNAFGSDSITQDVQVGIGSLTTLFASNNGGSVGGAVYFDVTVTNPISINAFETNYDVTAGSAVGLTVFTCSTTYVGNEANPAAWTQVGIDNGAATSAGMDLPSLITLQSAFTLLPGNYGMALVSMGDGHRYTNGTGANQNFSNTDLALTLGAATNVPFSGSPYSPRVWNGSVVYAPSAGSVDYGTGTDSGLNNGAPTMTTSALPMIGQTAILSVTQYDPNASGWMVIGVGRGPTPLPWGPLHIAAISHAMPAASPMPLGVAHAFNFSIPNTCSLSGAVVNWVNINLVPGAPNMLSLSNGVEWTVN